MLLVPVLAPTAGEVAVGGGGGYFVLMVEKVIGSKTNVIACNGGNGGDGGFGSGSGAAQLHGTGGMGGVGGEIVYHNFSLGTVRAQTGSTGSSAGDQRTGGDGGLCYMSLP